MGREIVGMALMNQPHAPTDTVMLGSSSAMTTIAQVPIICVTPVKIVLMDRMKIIYFVVRGEFS